MRTYSLPCNWEISVPDHWQQEDDKEDGHCMLYPNNSDLTVHITPFQVANQDGMLAPVELMEEAFTRTLPASAIVRGDIPCHLNGFTAKRYDNTMIKDHCTVYVIYIGYYATGELLSIGIWGTNKTECEKALDILETIKRTTSKK